MTPSPTMGLLLIELIWILSSMPVLAVMEGNRTLPWPDGGNSDIASKYSVQKERSKRNGGSELLFSPLFSFIYQI